MPGVLQWMLITDGKLLLLNAFISLSVCRRLSNLQNLPVISWFAMKWGVARTRRLLIVNVSVSTIIGFASIALGTFLVID